MALISTAEAAKRLGLAPKTLYNWMTARRRCAPPHRKIGGRVRFCEVELAAWIAAQPGRSLSESTNAGRTAP